MKANSLLLFYITLCSSYGKVVNWSNVLPRMNGDFSNRDKMISVISVVTGQIMDAHDGTYNQWKEAPGVWFHIYFNIQIYHHYILSKVLLRHGLRKLQTKSRYVQRALRLWVSDFRAQ